MYIRSFDWDEKNENHIAGHGVFIFEVEEAILFGRPYIKEAGKVNMPLTVLRKKEDISSWFLLSKGADG